jgi:Mn2+/Fe2+ NRAMP family transporter
MIAVQEMCGRIGIVTGKGLAGVIKSQFPKWMLYGLIGLLLVANIFNIYADLNAMAASLNMLLGGPIQAWLLAISAILIATIIAIPYTQYVKGLRWLCLSLAAYAIVVFMPGVQVDLKAVLQGLWTPTMHLSASWVLTVVGYLGTTISPYLFFWQTDEEVEEEIESGAADNSGHRLHPIWKQEILNMRVDTVVGMVISQVVATFIVICTAATLFASGHRDIQTAQDAAQALVPLGRSAVWLFTLGIVGTGMLAIPTLAGSSAYAMSEAAGWRYGLSRPFREAKHFYFAIAACVAIGCGLNFVQSINPVRALLYSAALNGTIAPILIVVILLICRNQSIMGQYRNGLTSTILGIFAVAAMGLAAVLLALNLTGLWRG